MHMYGILTFMYVVLFQGNCKSKLHESHFSKNQLVGRIQNNFMFVILNFQTNTE